MTTVTKRGQGMVAQVLDRLGTEAPWRGIAGVPAVPLEDYVEDSTYVLRAELPGIDPATDVELDVQGHVLTIRAQRTEESHARDRSEFRYGSFSRSVTLPGNAVLDEVRASYRHGVLEVTVPLDSSSSPRKVPVQRIDDETLEAGVVAGNNGDEDTTQSAQ